MEVGLVHGKINFLDINSAKLRLRLWTLELGGVVMWEYVECSSALIEGVVDNTVALTIV